MWSRNGRTLYYLDSLHVLIAADIRRDSSGVTFARRTLFQAPPTSLERSRDQYIPTESGRFLFNARVQAQPTATLLVGINWQKGIQRRVTWERVERLFF